eukprot:gene9520-5199_t
MGENTDHIAATLDAIRLRPRRETRSGLAARARTMRRMVVRVGRMHGTDMWPGGEIHCCKALQPLGLCTTTAFTLVGLAVRPVLAGGADTRRVLLRLARDMPTPAALAARERAHGRKKYCLLSQIEPRYEQEGRAEKRTRWKEHEEPKTDGPIDKRFGVSSDVGNRGYRKRWKRSLENVRAGWACPAGQEQEDEATGQILYNAAMRLSPEPEKRREKQLERAREAKKKKQQAEKEAKTGKQKRAKSEEGRQRAKPVAQPTLKSQQRRARSAGAAGAATN